jgi:uncharacterized protein
MATITLILVGYLVFGQILLLPLLWKARQNGISVEQIAQNTSIMFSEQLVGWDRNIILSFQFGLFVFTLIGFYVGIKYIHKKTFIGVITAYDKFRFKRFWFAVAVWGSLLVFTVLVNLIIEPQSMEFVFKPGGFIASVIIMIVFMPIQTGVEEFIFRGYLVQGLAQIFKNGIVPVIITSLLFGLLHMGNPEVAKHGWEIMLCYYVTFALFLGCITLIDEGLELAYGIHFANNIVGSILVSSSNSVIKTYSIFEVKVDDPRGELVLLTCMSIVTFFIFRVRYRWKNFKLIIK